MLSVAVQASGESGTLPVCAAGAAGVRPASRMPAMPARNRRTLCVIGVLGSGRVRYDEGDAGDHSPDEPSLIKVSPGGERQRRRSAVNIEHYERGPFVVSTDPARLDAVAIHDYLSTSYWADGIPLALVQRSLEASLCFGLYAPDGQIGLVRVITDRATFAYLCDVYVLTSYQGRGLGRWLMQCVMGSGQLQGLRRWMLVTLNAHRLYDRAGFRVAANPERIMEIIYQGLYRRPAPA